MNRNSYKFRTKRGCTKLTGLYRGHRVVQSSQGCTDLTRLEMLRHISSDWRSTGSTLLQDFRVEISHDTILHTLYVDTPNNTPELTLKSAKMN
jgi:hypothetical protein